MSSPTVSMMARHVQSPPEHFGWIEPELSSYRLEPGQSVSEFPFRLRVLLGRERRIRRRIVAKHLRGLFDVVPHDEQRVLQTLLVFIWFEQPHRVRRAHQGGPEDREVRRGVEVAITGQRLAKHVQVLY